MTTQTLTINFHGTDLFIVEHDGQPYTPMKTIVEGMGLNWSGQLAKLNANPERWGITKIVIPTLGDMQEAVCMPLRKLFGWLATIHPKKVKPELRDTIICYQNECDDVLWNHWTKEHVQYGLKQLPEPPTITKAQQGELFTIVSNKAHSAGKPHAYFWSRFQNHFKLSSYKLTPAEKFDEAKEYLRKLEGEDKDAFMMLTAKELSSIIRENMDRAKVGEVMPKDTIGGVILKFEGDEPQKLLVSVGPLGTQITKLLPDEMVIKKGQYYIMERKDKVSAGKLVLDYIPSEFLPYMIEVAAGRIGRSEAGKSKD